MCSNGSNIIGLSILIIFLSYTNYAQNCDTIGGKVLNCIDSSGLKQGYWETYHEVASSDDCFPYLDGEIITVKCSAGYCGTRHEYKKVIASKGNYINGLKEGEWAFRNQELNQIKGSYKNDKKIGIWKYYSDCHLIYLIKEITYFEDGSVKKDNRTADLYTLNINKDTTAVTGELNYRKDGIKIVIDCSENNCKLTLPNKQILLDFTMENLNDLDYELYRIRIGVYDKELNQLLSM